MKNRHWKWPVSILIILLFLVACSEQEPATEEATVPQEAPELQEDVQEVEPEAAEASEPAELVEEAAEAAYPAEDMPEISQPIYSWGEVADRVWVLVGFGDALNPTVVEEGVVITAVFSSTDGRVSGTSGCNNYFTSYESTGDGGLTISSPVGMTMMACPQGMEVESAYLGALETASAWNLNENGNLELTYSSGQPYEEKLVYVSGQTSLTGNVWQLVNFGDPQELAPLEEGTSITAVFLPDTDTTGAVGGNASCNNFNGGYTLEGNNISFGPIAGTRMTCVRGMEQETAYLAALQSAQTYEIIGPNMQIVYDGGVLNYTSLNLPQENVLWQAVVVGGEVISDEVEITALFVPGAEAGQGTVGGNAGCNNYNGGYESSSDLSSNPPTHAISVTPNMAMTMMACPDEGLALLEQAYLAMLGSAESYEILGDQMILHSPEGDIQYAADRQPLLGTLWTLVSLGDVNNPQPPVEGADFTAVFNRLPTLPSGTVTGETGCNEYNATFAADLTNIKINLPQKSNNEDCPWGVGNFEVEQQYFLGLNSATSYRIIGNNLQLMYGDGEKMQAMNFVATQPDVEESALDLMPLAGTFWYLSAIGDTAILAGSEVTAGFEIDESGVTGEISGTGGCNAYNAAIGENFTVGPIASTQKACQAAVMEQETTYFAWLSTAYGYDRAGDQLLIPTANGVLTFNSTPILDQSRELQNTTWYLISYETLNAIPGSNPTALFATDGQTVSGTTGCNEYGGAYKAEQGNKLTISGFTLTRAACASDALTKQEEMFLRLMPAAVNYAVSSTQLQIVTVDGGTMNFSSIPPQAPAGPTAVIVSGDFADTGQQMTFDGSQSTAGSLPIASYVWDMGDGATLTGPSVKYTFNNAGSYTVSLTVTDRAGGSDTTSKTVQVNPVVEVVPPTAAIEGPGAAFVGDAVTFSAVASQQGTAAIANYQWQSGDGNNTGLVPGNSFTTVYSQPGTYYPTVTVADTAGLSDSASMAITINAGLSGTNWILSGTITGTAISLEFGNGSLSGFAGCNSYNASYSSTRAGGNTNNISLGPISSTAALCPEEIMSQEQAYLASLQTASSYTINGSTLTLTTASGPLTYGAATAVPLPAVVPATSQ